MVRTSTREQNQEIRKVPDFYTLLFIEDRLFEKFNIVEFDNHINANFNLSKYGKTVEQVTYDVTILSQKRPENLNRNRYFPSQKRMVLSIELDYEKAVQLDKKGMREYLKEGLITCLNRPTKIKGFDFETFREDFLQRLLPKMT